MVTAPNDVAQLLLTRGLVKKSQSLGPNLIENDTAGRGLDSFTLSISIDRLPAEIGVLNPDAVVRADASFRHCKFHFGRIREQRETLAILARATWVLRKVITAERDVLGGRCDRLAAGWRENVIRGEHKHARFHLGLHRERHVHGHLIAVEVRIVSGADQRMDANGFALDQLRLKSLN